MHNMSSCFLNRCASTVRATLVLAAFWCAGAQALTAEQARALAVGDTESRIAALARVSSEPDDKLVAFIQALADDAVKTTPAGQVLITQGERAIDPVTGLRCPCPPTPTT